MPDAVIPLGVLSVMAATQAHHEKIFWDLCFEADPLGAVARNLRESKPELVAIGLRNLQNMDYTNITSNLDAYRATRCWTVSGRASATRSGGSRRLPGSQPQGLPFLHSPGTTDETLERVARTLDFVEELDPFAAVMLVWVEDSEVVNAHRLNSSGGTLR